MNLALLTDPRSAPLLSRAERSIIDACVPGTTRLTKGTALRALQSKSDFVLKPALGCGGVGVAIGESLSAAAWKRSLDEALKDRDTWILQRRIEDIWCYEAAHDASTRRRYTVCLGSTLFGGQHGGVLLRQSEYTGTSRVINITQGAAFGTALHAAQQT
jgi:hypothetical protein